MPSQLSGGQQQRVAVARAVVGNQGMILADEPTGNLDSRTGGHVMDLMFELNRDSSTTLILVTHDKSLAARCDRVIGLDAGKLVRLWSESDWLTAEFEGPYSPMVRTTAPVRRPVST